MTGHARERTHPPLIVALWARATAAFGRLALATSGESFTTKLSFDGAPTSGSPSPSARTGSFRPRHSI